MAVDSVDNFSSAVVFPHFENDLFFLFECSLFISNALNRIIDIYQ